MINNRFALALPLTLAVGLLAGPGFAQAPAAKPVAASASARLHDSVDKRISDLHARLKITPDEQPTFDEFAGVMRENATHMDGLLQQRRSASAGATAVDDMKSYQTMAQAHVDDLNRLVPAFSKLYDALSPDQKKLADTSFRQFQQRGLDGSQRG
jgi:protein CpxP